MTAMTAIPTTVHVVLPNDIDDPTRPSGGNHYDRQLCRGLASQRVQVLEHAVVGEWPAPTLAQQVGLARRLSRIPDGAVVLLDGLVAAAVPQLLRAQAQRLRLVVLVHAPLDNDAEAATLATARAVIATSAWTRQWLLQRYVLAPDRVHTAVPGVDPARLVATTSGGARLLCVAVVAPHKGHDLLVTALAKIAELGFSCRCVGSLQRDPPFVAQLREQIDGYGLADRVHLAGCRTGAALDAEYASADLMVLASRREAYGMVVTEALARGIPVLATAVGGLPEALGTAVDGDRPGLLVPPDDSTALAAALRCWLTDTGLRERLRHNAHSRRATLTGWGDTVHAVLHVLRGVLVTRDGSPWPGM
jgi:glycosyltransferase involved in cell wall biosynthesis